MKSSMHPHKWEDLKNLTVQGRRDSDFVVTKPPKQRSNDFAYGFRTPEKGVVESLRNALDDWKPAASNEMEAKRLVVAKNHRYGNSKRVAEIQLEYLRSLEQFNVCFNCELPIRTKRAFLSNKEVWETYGDVAEHFAVRPRKDNPKKWEYIRVKAHRVFNLRCQCQRKVDRKVEKARERE